MVGWEWHSCSGWYSGQTPAGVNNTFLRATWHHCQDNLKWSQNAEVIIHSNHTHQFFKQTAAQAVITLWGNSLVNCDIMCDLWIQLPRSGRPPSCIYISIHPASDMITFLKESSFRVNKGLTHFQFKQLVELFFLALSLIKGSAEESMKSSLV